jgi:16S rRNA processing protein RimM
LSSDENNAVIGMVSSPHGVGGLVKVFPYSDFPERINSLDRVVLQSNLGQKEMLIETASIYGRFWLVKFKGIDSREQAVSLRESLLIIPLAQRVALPEGSYYHDQLIGLKVLDFEGQLIGKVVDLHVTGGHDLLIVKKEDEAEQKFMIPAVKKFVRKVDQKAKIIVVELPEGLLDL